MIIIAIVLLTIFKSSLADSQVLYKLTTPEGDEFTFTNANFTKLTFNATREYKIICHGWMANGDWYGNLTNEYMKKGNVNVIGTYYTQLMSDPFYIYAVSDVSHIGAKIAELILNLNETKNVPIKNFHLIGHSLGAHIVGTAGEFIHTSSNIRVARITGLDPAFPGFYVPYSNYKDQNRLSKDDADFVDIIHTGFLSVPTPIGDVDFFPNGGWDQRGCESTTIRLICNHQMAIIFFILSVSGRELVGKECANYEMFKNGDCDNADTLLLGSHTNKTGTYYFDVNIIEEYVSVFPNNIQSFLDKIL